MKQNHSLILSVMATIILAATPIQADEAQDIYKKDCAKCHGVDGKGQTKMGAKLGIKDLTDAKVQAELKDDQAFKNIKEGVKDGDKTLMKAAEGVTDAQIKALVAYVRTFKK